MLAAARRRAQHRGETLGQFVEAALRRELADDDEGSTPPPIPVFTGGTGPAPGVDLTSNRAVAEIFDEELDLDRRR